MSKHNYSQYSNKKYEKKIDTTPEVTEENQNGVETTVNEEVETTVIAPVEATAEATVVTETVVEEPKTGAVSKGVVANCAKLNVRSKPSTSADIVTVLNVNDKVTIDVDESTEDWFKICTADGVKGYCMRKFVSANI